MGLLLEHEPTIPNDNEQEALKAIKHLLQSAETCFPKLVGPQGEPLELPPSLRQVLQQVVEHLAAGQVVTPVSFNQEITSYEAASILTVSHQHLLKLLEEGILPSRKVEGIALIPFSDLMEYKKRDDAQRQEAMTELVRLSEEMGLYDEGGA